jgi:hypothetical protein
MSPLPGFFASEIQGHLSAPAFQGDFWALNTVTLSSTASSVTFTGIPQNYRNLQLRIFGQTNRGTYGIDEACIRFNSDTTNNYADHAVYGDGSAPAAVSDTSANKIFLGTGALGTTTSGFFGINIADILDYTSTTKNKTVRTLGGADVNGTVGGIGGRVSLGSGVWLNSLSPVTSVTLIPGNGSAFTAYSSFALYGVK